MLKLILPEEKYWESFISGLEEMKNHPTLYDTNAIKSGLKFDNFADYKLDCENSRQGIGLKEGHVACTRLWLIEDEKFVGIFDIRHSLTESLKEKGGHISYYTIPSARKRGIATQGLKLCCQYSLDVLMINEVLVTCNALNIASYKTMKKVMFEYGGVESAPVLLDDSEQRRVWIKTKPREEKIRPLAVAIIAKENKVLAIRGYDDIKGETFYRLVGGGIEFWEKGEDTIKREFMEELGFEPINIQYKTTSENIFEFNGKKGHEIVLVYTADLPKNLREKNKFYIQEEMLKGKYAEFVEAEGNLIFPEDVV